jgi:hypothetical protein
MQLSAWGYSGLVGVVLVGLTACSVTDYQEPITKFATASHNAETALNALNTEVTDAYTALLRERAIAGEALVEIAEGDCVVRSEHCRLNLFNRDESSEPLTPPPVLGNMVALMESISIYADNLAALVSADTAAAVTTHVNAALGSVESLANTVEAAGGAKPAVDLSAYRTPVGDAFRWIVGQYVATVKLNGLRRATREAQPVIAEATRTFEIAAEHAAVVPQALMAADVDKRLAAFGSSRTQDDLAKLIQSASQFNQFLEVNPSNVFAKMNAAHEALTNQLQGKDVTLAQALARIQIFAAEAEALANIARSFSAAAKTET